MPEHVGTETGTNSDQGSAAIKAACPRFQDNDAVLLTELELRMIGMLARLSPTSDRLCLCLAAAQLDPI